MKRTLWHITKASLFTLIAYIALYAIWRAILGTMEQGYQLFILATITSTAYSFFLLYVSKIQKGIGESEILADYKDKAYTSLWKDVKLVLSREQTTLIGIGGVILFCFILNRFDSLVFGKKVISFPTFFFTPMYLYGTCFKLQFLGYLYGAAYISAVYLLLVLLYRKKCYKYWMCKL